jgi:hypothetical protein
LELLFSTKLYVAVFFEKLPVAFEIVPEQKVLVLLTLVVQALKLVLDLKSGLVSEYESFTLFLDTTSEIKFVATCSADLGLRNR